MLRALFLCVITLFSTASYCQIQPESSPSVVTTDNDDIVFTKAEIEAEFPGGMKGWKSYLMENLQGDVAVKKKAPVGTYKVLVRFIVSKKGKISDITALTNNGYGMEKEVIRIIKKGPDWSPAIQNGRAVNAYRIQPVVFVVSEE